MKLIKNIFIGLGLITLAYIVVWGLQNTGITVKYTSSTIVQALESMQKIETTKMSMSKIIEGEDELFDLFPSVGIDDIVQNALFKDKMILEVEGNVIAGYDLSKIQTGDVKLYPVGVLSIVLPEAEILSISLSEKTKPFARELGILTKGNLQLETELRNQAKEMIKEDALAQGILDQAEHDIKKLLLEQFEKAGLLIHRIIIKKEQLD